MRPPASPGGGGRALSPALRDAAQFPQFAAAGRVSYAGTAISGVVLPIPVYRRTGSAWQTFLLMALEIIPYLLFGLPAGAVADGVSHERLTQALLQQHSVRAARHPRHRQVHTRLLSSHQSAPHTHKMPADGRPCKAAGTGDAGVTDTRLMTIVHEVSGTASYQAGASPVPAVGGRRLPFLDRARIYACGITPYDVTHLGHAAAFVWIDALTSTLRFLGIEPEVCRNITDVDDVLDEAARRAGTPYDSFAAVQQYHFEQDMAARWACAPQCTAPARTGMYSR